MTTTPPPLIGGWHVRPADLDGPFWSGLASHELRIQRCADCQTWIWAPQWRCGSCGSWELRWPDVAPVGRIYSWIRTWHPVASEVADAVPYVTLLVVLPHAGDVRLLGISVDDVDPATGSEVAVSWSAMGGVENPYALCWTSAAGGA